MHKNVVAHPYALDEEHVDELARADFAFVAIDRGTGKRLIIEKLEQMPISFIDVGMGVSADDGALGGLLRVTSSLRSRPMAERGRMSLADLTRTTTTGSTSRLRISTRSTLPSR